MKSGNQLPLKFHESLFEQIYAMDSLYQAFKAVKKNKGAPGIDKISVTDYLRTLKRSLTGLSEDVKNWRYKPSPVKTVEIPKPNGGVRKLGIPTVRDRVLQMSIKMAIEPLIDSTFSERSFGFRPGRNQHQALELAKKTVNSGREWVVDIDLSKFFDRINHDRLIHRLKNYFDDRRVLRLIAMTLRSGAITEGIFVPSDEGSVQGSPLSPLLSNVVLDELDKEMEKRGHKFCRFADDMNSFVKSEKAAHRLMESITTFIEKKMKLVVNREKSKVALASAVKFLGFTIIAGSISISKVSLDKAMDKTKELTPRGTHQTMEISLKKINQWYMGWANYYKLTEYPAQLAKIEAHIRRRLRARIIRQKKKRRHLVKDLLKKGAYKGSVFKHIYSNKSTWAMSISPALHQGYPNKWFMDRGQKIFSDRNLPHWKKKNEWVRLS